MEKDFALIELFDIYGGLLTDRQRELFASYYLFDLSLKEIAEPEGKTRQNVYEQVKKVKAKLLEYESLLHVKTKNQAALSVADQLSAQGNPLGDKLKEILSR